MGHSMGLEFETAARNDTEDIDEGKTFGLDGAELRYYRPTNGQIAMVMALTEQRKGNQTKIAGLIDFFFSIFDEESQQLLYKRLFDRTDSFDIDSKGGINDILDELLAEWAARPTKRSSDFTKSPATTGPSSTPSIQV